MLARVRALRRVRDFVRRSDWPLVPVAAAIVAAGIVVQWSVAGPGSFPSGHLQRVAAAALAMVAAAALPARIWRDFAYLFYAGCFVLLVFLLVGGEVTNNSRRWISLFGGFKIQPSEFMKLALLLSLAHWFAERGRPQRLWELVVPGGLSAAAFVLVLAEPDLGTALSFMPMFLAMAWLAGTRRRLMLLIVAVPLVVAPLGFLTLRDYQAERLSTWWHQDTLTTEQKGDTGYHLWHSKMAIGGGGLTGFGWGDGPENRLARLPERNTDFAFSVLAEDFGFVGASGLVLLYASLAAGALWCATRHRHPFTRLVLAGIGVHFAVHLVINVGVATGLWPTTGLPLPMVSHGGSSLVVSGLALGVALSVSGAREPVLWQSRLD